VRPEQVWVPDITHIRLCSGFVYLAVIMDVLTRGIRGWDPGRSLDHTLTRTALQRALAKHSAPELHHADQGVQYAATAYTKALQDVNVQISMADVGEAWQNGRAERLMRAIKEEEVDFRTYLGTRDDGLHRRCLDAIIALSRDVVNSQLVSRESEWGY
jgi:putative transposase